jgi:hypothetical protein
MDMSMDIDTEMDTHTEHGHRNRHDSRLLWNAEMHYLLVFSQPSTGMKKTNDAGTNPIPERDDTGPAIFWYHTMQYACMMWGTENKHPPANGPRLPVEPRRRHKLVHGRRGSSCRLTSQSRTNHWALIIVTTEIMLLFIKLL